MIEFTLIPQTLSSVETPRVFLVRKPFSFKCWSGEPYTVRRGLQWEQIEENTLEGETFGVFPDHKSMFFNYGTHWGFII